MLIVILTLKVLVLLLSLTGYQLFFARQFRWPLEITPLFTASLLIALLYLSYFIGWLQVAALGLFGFGIAALGLELGLASKQRRSLVDLFSPGYVFYLIMLAICWLKVNTAYFHGSDEFSHWGVFSKYLFMTHSFATVDSPLLFKDYPPAAALFHYFCYQITGFKEGVTYFSQDILLLSALTVITRGSQWPQWKNALLKFCLVLVIYFNFSHGLVSVMIDSVVGVFWGMALVSYYLSKKDAQAICALLPVVFVLPLLKSVGLLLAVLAALIIALDQLLVQHQPKQASGAVLLLVTALIANSTWSAHLKQQHIGKTFSTEFSWQKLNNSFSSNASERDRQTFHSFAKAALTERIDKGIRYQEVGVGSAVSWTLILMLTGIALTRLNSPLRSEIRLVSIGMGLGLLIYAFGLLLLYLYSYGEYEGVRVASFSRYLAIYFLGWALVTYALIIKTDPWLKSANVAKKCVWVFFLFNAGGLVYAGIFLAKSFSQPEDFRRYVQPIAQKVQQHIKVNETVYTIWQDDPGTKKMSIDYELLPVTFNHECWSVTKAQPEKVWTCRLTEQELLNRIKSYDYLLIAVSNPQFWADYGKLLAPELQRYQWLLLKIKHNHGKVAFQVVTTSLEQR